MNVIVLQVFRITWFLIFFAYMPALAGKPLPLSPTYQKYLETRFLESSGRVSNEKLRAYINELKTRRNENIENYAKIQFYKKNRSESEAYDKALKSSTVELYDYIIARAESLALNSARSSVDIFKELQLIVEFDQALKSEIRPHNDPKYVFQEVKSVLTQFYVDKTYDVEAENLVNPKTGEYYSQEELKILKQSGFDISRLDPPANNGVIELTSDTSKFDVLKRYNEGVEPLHQGFKPVIPDGNEAFFVEVRKTQSKPKISIVTKDKSGKKLREYKLKLGVEVHSEPTSGALSSALGIFVDLTRYVENFKVRMGEISYEEFKLDWNSYYKKYDVDKYVKEVGRDSLGNFIVFKQAHLEFKFEDENVKRVGPWFWGRQDHKARREFRALRIYNLWINNADNKEAENNKFVVRDGPAGLEQYFLQQDLGYGFGHFAREKPTDFLWKLIDNENSSRVTFNHRPFQPSSGWDYVSLADARWMTRKIAQLTREQITTAVKLGGWPNQAPYNYEQLLIEKLIHRRNELVRVFGLNNEFPYLKVHREVEKEALPSPDGIEGETVNMRPMLKDVFIDPILEGLRNFTHDTIVNSIGAVNNIDIEPEWIGIDESLVSQVIINVNRTVTKNPEPRHLNDYFIVRDDYRIGFRLGYGLVIVGDVSYVRNFSLIFTVASEDEARNHRRFILDLTKPYAELLKELPSNHILISESFVEGRGRIKVDGGPISLGFDTSRSRIWLNRSIIKSSLLTGVTLFEDQSVYNETAARIYLKLALVKLHFMRTSLAKGQVDRYCYHVDREQLDLVSAAIYQNDFSLIKEKAEKTQIKSDFTEGQTTYSLLGFASFKNKHRSDHVRVLHQGENGVWVENEEFILSDRESKKSWSFLTNSETHAKTISYTTQLINGETKSPVIEINYMTEDKNVKLSELENRYLPLIDAAAGEKNFLNFTPRLHGAYETWGDLILTTRIFYYEKAIQKILTLTPEEFYLALSPLVRESVGVLKQKTDTRYASFLKSLKWAQKAKKQSERLKYLLNALDKLTYGTLNEFRPHMISALNQLLGKDSYYIDSMVTDPTEDIKLPGGPELFNARGELMGDVRARKNILFNLEDALDVYLAFR